MRTEKTALLFGPYRAPRLKVGDRAFCLYRDGPVVIRGLSSARIDWPRCRPLDPPRGPLGLLVDEELARAIRNESATAVAYWWGVDRTTVIKWRRALGVTRKNNQGTHRLVLGAIQASLDSRFGKDSRRASDGAASRPSRGRKAVWTPEEVALLGALTDPEVARRTGRSLHAVNNKRWSLGRPALAEGARGPRRVYWTAEEDEAVRTLPAREVARRYKRTLGAIERRRLFLGVDAARK
jgi:hypothetical protein